MTGSRVFPPVASGPHRSLRAVGAAAAATLAGIHLDRLVPAARAAAYLGVLFAVAAASLAGVALRLLWSDGADGWLAGAGLAAGIALGYVLSCTVGLPGIAPERWSALGDVGVGLEGMLLAAAVARSRAPRNEEP